MPILRPPHLCSNKTQQCNRMSEALDSALHDEIKYRLRNPFYSSWVIGFVLWNWEAILFIVYPSGEWDLHYRLNWIEGNIYDEAWKWILMCLIMPLVTAVAAVAVMPWVINRLDDMRYWALIDQRNRRMKRDELLMPAQKRIVELQQGLEKEVAASKQFQSELGRQREVVLAQERLVTESQRRLEVTADQLFSHDREYVEALKMIVSGTRLSSTAKTTNVLEALGVILRDDSDEWKLTEFGLRLYARHYIDRLPHAVTDVLV